MAIRIRKVDNELVALCAAEHEACAGDLYLDDAVHYALAEKFMADWKRNGLIPTPPASGQVVDVVAAVRRYRDRYWICRRTGDGAHGGLAGMWEYPGGKVEQGETPEEALRREMREEFDVGIEILDHLDTINAKQPTGDGPVYRVMFYRVVFLSLPKLRCHDREKWATVAELQQDEHLLSGVEFNRRLAARPVRGGEAAGCLKT